jgi:hypothetical protein
VIVRIESFGAKNAALSIPGRVIAGAFLTDALERDIEKLSVDKKGVSVPLEHTITTVRLLLKG